MDFTVVILDKHVSAYAGITWSEWKDSNRKQMRSEGDNWSKATLQGNDIWNALTKTDLSPSPGAMETEADTLYKVIAGPVEDADTEKDFVLNAGLIALITACVRSFTPIFPIIVLT